MISFGVGKKKKVRGKTSWEKIHLRVRCSVKSRNVSSSGFAKYLWSGCLPWLPKDGSEPREHMGSLKPDHLSLPHFLQPILQDPIQTDPWGVTPTFELLKGHRGNKPFLFQVRDQGIRRGTASTSRTRVRTQVSLLKSALLLLPELCDHRQVPYLCQVLVLLPRDDVR